MVPFLASVFDNSQAFQGEYDYYFLEMLKRERVKAALLRQKTDQFPVFMSATPQFLQKALKNRGWALDAVNAWRYCVALDLDVVQVGHPSFYPVKVLELPVGGRYSDEWGRNHIISEYYDNFCGPFPLLPEGKVDLPVLESRWSKYKFPNAVDPAWFKSLDAVVAENKRIENPLSVWGVINGPFEPTWQLLSDGWPAFFILARRKKGLALEIIGRVTDYCIQAGQEMIRRGAEAIRIGDDYALNEGPMCAPEVWHELIYPAHKRLVAGLKAVGGADFPVILHSDGNVMSLLNWLGEGGLDALNPIQPDALDFAKVVDAIGNKLAMTAAFDLRYFLRPPGADTDAAMAAEIKRLFGIIDAFNQRGGRCGYCIASTHQVQPGSYVETFESWVNLVHQANQKRRN